VFFGTRQTNTAINVTTWLRGRAIHSRDSI